MNRFRTISHTPAAQALKRHFGSCLVNLCATLPGTRPLVQRLGLHTSKEWFQGRVVAIPLPWGGRIKLASFGWNYLSFELFWKGLEYYEPITTLLSRRLAKETATFVDAGANIGFYSLVLAVSEPRIRVIAFEPNPHNFALLQDNVRANGLAQVRCESLALSDANTEARLYLSASDMSASLCQDFDAHPVGRITVQTCRLDSYFARCAARGPLLIKVDVEGHESAFFRGAREMLGDLKPDLIAEVALPYDAETTELLRAAGYRFYSITDRGLLESAVLRPVVKDPLVFLNYLISARPAVEVAAMFEDIRPRVRKIDLRRTSKFLTPAALRQFKDRIHPQTLTPASSETRHVWV